MAYEPRPVPQVPEPILQSYWYCLECGYNNAARSTVVNHFKSTHGDDGYNTVATEGFDFCRGDQLVTLKIRRETWIEAQVAELARELEPLQTAEDVIAELEIHGA